MDKVKVSGCIVTYNNADIISGCIESLLRETKGVDFTLYIVDNNSTDNTTAIIKEKFPQVILIENRENGGFGHGHNTVLNTVDSKYHAVINPDIYVEGDVIAALVKVLEKDDKVAMATPKILNEDHTEQFLPKKDPSIRYVIMSKFKPFKKYRKEYTRELENIDEPVYIDMCTGCFFVIRTEVFRAVGGFDERFFMYCEDADLSRRVRKEHKIVFYPYTCATHKWSRANTKDIRGIMRFLTSLFKYFMKWGINF